MKADQQTAKITIYCDTGLLLPKHLITVTVPGAPHFLRQKYSMKKKKQGSESLEPPKVLRAQQFPLHLTLFRDACSFQVYGRLAEVNCTLQVAGFKDASFSPGHTELPKSNT